MRISFFPRHYKPKIKNIALQIAKIKIDYFIKSFFDEIMKALPKNLANTLPSLKEIEPELSHNN